MKIMKHAKEHQERGKELQRTKESQDNIGSGYLHGIYLEKENILEITNSYPMIKEEDEADIVLFNIINYKNSREKKRVMIIK